MSAPLRVRSPVPLSVPPDRVSNGSVKLLSKFTVAPLILSDAGVMAPRLALKFTVPLLAAMVPVRP